MDNWVMTESGWRHRPLWKVAINATLRWLQFWSDYPLLIATVCAALSDERPIKVGYTISRVRLSRPE